jgi:tetratricopeptide (TPR) repeat protein
MDPAVRGGAFVVAGRSAMEAGEVERAEPWLRRGLELTRSAGDDLRTAWALHGLGHLAGEQGDSKRAQRLFEESMELFLRLGEHAPAGGRMTFLAHYAAHEGDLERARSLYEGAADQYRLAGDNGGVGLCIHGLGDLALQQGDAEVALEHYREAQPLIRKSGSLLDLEYLVAGTAAAAGLLGRSAVAARLWGAVERLDAESDRRMEASERGWYERALGRLDEREREAGRSLTVEEAVALAQETADALAATLRSNSLRTAGHSSSSTE